MQTKNTTVFVLSGCKGRLLNFLYSKMCYFYKFNFEIQRKHLESNWNKIIKHQHTQCTMPADESLLILSMQ